MSAHTPGPWEIDGNIAVRSSVPNGRQVCLCEITVRGRPPYDETYDEAAANARLIAAAPDLLAALKAIVAPYGGFFCTSEKERQVRAAIAKAEGTP